jgi:TolB protein
VIRLPVSAGLVVLVAVLLVSCGGEGKARPDLAFVSTRDGPYAIYEMNANGRAQHRLTEADTDVSKPEGLFFQVEPAWSPDGTQIAFASGRSGSLDIYVMSADGTGTVRLTTTREDDSHPTWSADGEEIAFARTQDIYVMNADGSGVRRISDPGAEETEPAWSPNGKWIAYVRRDPGSDVRDIRVMGPDGAGARRVTSLHANSINPAWSPDSTRLAFASNVLGPLYDIFMVTVGEKGVRRLSRVGPDAFEPSWSPDGTKVAFSQNGSILTVDLERNTEELTDPDGNDSSPAWNPKPPADK